GFHRFDGPAAVLAAHLGNHAETARMIATFGNFQVRKMPGGQSESRGSIIGNVSRFGCDKIQRRRGCSLAAEHLANDFAGLSNLIESHECVHLWNLVREFSGKSL